MMLNSYMRQIISGMMGRLAVPMFFAISGFLFFRGTEQSIQVVYQKLRRRVKTLVIPFVLAALFLPSVFLILKLSGLLDHVYELDKRNSRFFYDHEGYPLMKEKLAPMTEAVEKKLVERPFDYGWGQENSSTWTYMSTITEYSYLLAYQMFPKGCKNSTFTIYSETEAAQRFQEYCTLLMTDAIDSIARVWLHVWIRYRRWAEENS